MTNSKNTWVKSALIACIVGVGLFAIGDLTGGVDSLRTAANKMDVEKKEESYDQLDDVDIDLHNRDLIIEDSDDQKVHLTYYHQKKREDKISIKQENSKLTIKERGANRSHVIIGFNLDFLHLFRDSAHEERAVTLRLPKGTKLKNLTVYSDNGPVKLATSSKLLTQQLDVDLANGELTIDQLDAEEFKISNDNGMIQIKNSQLLSGFLTADNGEVELNQSKLANGKVSLHNGTFRSSQLDLDGSNTFDNDNGGLEFNLTAASYQDLALNLKTELGGITAPSDISVNKNDLSQNVNRQVAHSKRILNATSHNGEIVLTHD